jgi:hypothetical protein
MENYEAKVVPDHVIGFTEKGQYTGTRILANGRTAKITVNDYVTNGALTPPPDISNPILVGVIVHEDSHYSEDNRARVITPNKRVRTYESIEYTESFTKGDTADGVVSPKL